MSDTAAPQYGDLWVSDDHYFYICPNGHNPTSPKPLKVCPAFKCGRRLERYGKGSRGSYQKGSK